MGIAAEFFESKTGKSINLPSARHVNVSNFEDEKKGIDPNFVEAVEIHGTSISKKKKKPAENQRVSKYRSGETGIRTRDTLLTYTRFPGVPLQPLEHLSLR